MKTKHFLKLRFKLLIFIVIYSVIFYYYRNSSYYNYRFLASNIDSLPWLYSTIGLIFGMISAFILQKEWGKWNDLEEAVKSECGALYEAWLWTNRLPLNVKIKIRESIKRYLQIIVDEGWEKTEVGEVSQELDETIRDLHQAAFDLNQSQPELSSTAFSMLNQIMTYREKRIRYGSSHIPQILLSTFRFATFLMIVLCPLIAIKAIELQFVFTLSIVILSYSIYIVAVDLDHPLRPGGWHLTTADYRRLLEKLKHSDTQK